MLAFPLAEDLGRPSVDTQQPPQNLYPHNPSASQPDAITDVTSGHLGSFVTDGNSHKHDVTRCVSVGGYSLRCGLTGAVKGQKTTSVRLTKERVCVCV